MSKRKRGIAILLLAFLLSVASAIPRAEPVNAARPRLNKTKVTLTKGGQAKLKVTGTKKKVKWSSNEKKVATVTNKGLVKARGKGTAKITAKFGKRRLICRVTVKAKKIITTPAPTLIPTPTLSDERISVNVGKQKQLKVFGASQVPRWWSTDNSVATVDEDGIVCGISPGVCRVYAELPGTYFMCFVSVSGKAGTTVTPTAVPTISGTPTQTPAPTESPAVTQTPVPTKIPSPSPTVTLTPTPGPTLTATPTVGPTQTPSVTPTLRPTQTPIPTITNVPMPTITPGADGEFNEVDAKNSITKQSYTVDDGVVVIVKNNYRYAMNLYVDCLYYDSRGILIGKNVDFCFGLEPGREAALFALNPYDSNYNYVKYSRYALEFRCEETYAICNADNILCTSNFGEGNLMMAVENMGQRVETTSIAVLFYKNGRLIKYENQYADVKSPGSIQHLKFDFPYDSQYETIVPDDYEVFVNYSLRYEWE